MYLSSLQGVDLGKIKQGVYIYWLVLWTVLKNDGVKVNGKDEIPYEMENKSQVWNHQPVVSLTIINHY